MKKRVLITGLIFGIVFILAVGPIPLNAVSYYLGFPIVQLQFNGDAVITDVPAIQANGRTLVPIRVISEKLGASVSWDEDTRTVSIEQQGAKTLPKRELIEFSNITTNTNNSGRSEITGTIKNNNKEWVSLFYTIKFYEPRGIIGHVDGYIEGLGVEQEHTFSLEHEKDIRSYSRYEIIFYMEQYTPSYE